MQKFKSVEELVNQLKPEKPVYCIRKKSIESAVKFFMKYLTADWIEFFLIQYTGFSGFSWFINSSTDLNFCIINASKKNLTKKSLLLKNFKISPY